jgi:hypothetical protein
MRVSNRFASPALRWLVAALYLLPALATFALADDEEPLTSFLTQPISSIDGYFPTPWGCVSADPGTQSVLQFHRNWHCNNPDNTGANWGNRFFGFHKQFLQGFNRYRAANGFPYIQTWVPSPGAIIPPAHRGRAANAPCPTCQSLPNTFRLPAAGGTLDTFATVDAIGAAIVGWHNTNHGRIGAAGGTDCNTAQGPRGDMSCVATSPRDPIFYQYHHIFDDVQNAWRTHQPTDIVLVFDRSGSMSLPAGGGGTRLQAARDAANMFADLLEDGSSHRVGLVSFATTATSPADMPLTGVAAAPATMSGTVGGVAASGATSIGAGLQVAMTTLAGGGNPRKAILLMTDGMENTSPSIADVQASLGDTHLCAVGFGTPGSLDGPKLRDLSERQGGIYISGPGALELRKFFVECFADIFDSFVGEDPIEVLGAGDLTSSPTVHTAMGDDKLTFVLSWDPPVPTGTLQLEVTDPTGAVLDLSDPSVESTLGPAWHIVRVELPYRGQQDGDWQARAVRATSGFVNGFMSDAFADPAAGTAFVQEQLRQLCGGGCGRVLFYEDDPMDMGEEMTFDMMLSAYADALFLEAGRGGVGEVVKVTEPQTFAEHLRKGDYDLLVYSSRYATTEQPYDDLLVRAVCGDAPPRFLLSDNRDTGAARELLRCAGVTRTGEDNFERLETDAGTLELTKPGMATGPFSYALEPAGAGAVLAKAPSGAAVSVAREVMGEEQRFFITALTRAAARVVPFTWTSRVYTGEALHPTFHIPEMYWPPEGYDRIEAVVEVTRPLRSVGELAAEVGFREPIKQEGDLVPPRAAGLLRLDPEGTNVLIPTETFTFPLFDDGTNGDGTAGDRYWEANLPEEVTKVDGDYTLRAIFTLCRDGDCVRREATHTLTVETKLDAGATEVRLEPLPAQGNVRRTRVLVTPRDASGLVMGPGLADTLQITPVGEVRLDGVSDADGRGTYALTVTWQPSFEEPALLITQFGRPQDALVVRLE